MLLAMSWIDWSIVVVALAIVLAIGMRTQRYMRGVADFLTAGRVAGRYVISVAGGEAAMGLISLVAMYESYYQSGFAYGFWGAVAAPVGMVLSLTGYCTYRFRETRAMTMGQFLEIRYSRRFRIFAGILQSISGILNYALFPAVGARFLVYYCDLPVNLNVFGWVFPTFALLMAIFLGLAVLIATKGGQVTIMVTDCVQGLLSYPIYVIIVAFFIFRFSWFKDLAPVITDRPPGQSMINPFDISELRDFNLFYVVVGILGAMINRMSWSGTQGYNAAARDAHEQKMGSVLGVWRAGFSTMMFVLLAVVAYAYLNGTLHQTGPNGAVACRMELGVKVAEDVIRGDELSLARNEIVGYLKTGEMTPALQDMLDRSAKAKTEAKAEHDLLRQSLHDAPENLMAEKESVKAMENSDAATRLRTLESRSETAREALLAVDPGVSQTFGTIYGQMRVPMALRYLLPTGLIGLFCAICVFLMLSTDTTYLHSWGSILIQDVVLPIRGRAFPPKQQLALLRWAIGGVAVFAFLFSWFFGQVDYILMFFAITGAIWIGGSGVCITAGLYWRRGTTPGAWVALISGSSLSVLGILLQKNWVESIYPWLCRTGLVTPVGNMLKGFSSPFEPMIKWRMCGDKFPINSQEIFFLTMLVSVGLYVLVSLLTSRRGRVFNIERMLHRGKYSREGVQTVTPPLTFRNVFKRLVGIDSQYSLGDKVLAWSVFAWSFGWGFLCCFVGVVLWNLISPWGTVGWTRWFFINNFVIAGIVGIVSTIWFTIGCTRDLRRLFVDLAQHRVDDLDDGRVEGHVSADDLALFAERSSDAVERKDETADGESSK